MAKPVTPQDMFDLWTKMVNPSAYPLQSLMFPVLDPEELDKKIRELETVEHWLRANLNMLQLSIKSLEYQRSLLRGGEQMREAMGGEDKGGGEIPNPAMWAWNMMAQAGKDAMQAAESATKPAEPAPKRARKARKPRAR